mmetsp:Transcript_9915/g.9602  ORF Transcript_9915/g.9602 Transcript_9915/m.9602 type:complete len:263 (-) Transcript_9915:149-937(-)|eukprot:CAMPEP_0197824268 /NCGR_PEP_ID=MMETSP1437-20131217/1534_1 /TAXON_ID=49252 ORGANISM="Eucampia antarctica, Strain CCMP1452" /NCGR_SAMPLE_ID=MMETSP1437 /ASSEMBLY_ACC=CAM_ASM_001096 /LENGTH=262 /DNA_ID=CAMNT_0043423817 /DNA_START=58 /DNA_END=846 /DNA_ORIENTATION=-
MQLIGPLVGGTVAAIVANSGLNMYQTFSIVSRELNINDSNDNDEYLAAMSVSAKNRSPILNEYMSTSKGTSGYKKSMAEVLLDLKGLKRSEFIELWHSCEAPSGMKQVDGEWNGILLDNNGPIMTSVSNILSNTFFAKNHGNWKGKKFDRKRSSSEGDGINRFSPRNSKYPKEDNGLPQKMELEHRFDCQIESSLLDTGKVLSLKYANYQSPFSLWHSMRDEVRVLKLSNGDKILVGLGGMKWSGAFWRDGMMNACPFLLWK